MLGSDGVNRAVGAEDTTIILDVFMPDTHAQIDEHTLTYRVGNDFGKHFPAV